MGSTATLASAAPGDLGDVFREYMDATVRLQRTHETLQTEMARLRQELASKDRELERRRRLAALGEIAAGVAHEVRNPLGAIQLYSGLLRSACGRQAEALALIEKIDSGIRAIDGVVQDTLSLAPRSCRLTLQPVASLIDGAVELVRSVLARHRVSVEVRLADENVAIPADAAALQRVLVNLIANAAEASPAGESVKVSAGRPQDGFVELRVSDRGSGLPDEVLENLFNPFFTTKQHGTGLGLAIAHRLIEAHGGQLTARNRPEGGAEFVLQLPADGPDSDLSGAQRGAATASVA